jgi:TFIIF-interacting CTD phosphatase-like protein
MSKEINVVLDLDNTLIYSIEMSKLKKNSPEWMSKFKRHKMDNEYMIFERPHLQSFLTWLFKNFNVMIWSAASGEYVEFIAKNIIEKNNRKLEYVLNSDNCEDSQYYYGSDNIKNLQLLWDIHDLPNFGPYNTLIIDDLFKVNKFNPHNSIRIKKFVTKEDSVNDQDLKRIKHELIKIKKHFKQHINDEEFKLI